eukprot:gene526-8038_t
MDPFQPLFRAVFSVLQVPRINLPVIIPSTSISKWSVFIIVMVSYFFFMSGIVYDMINEPPAIGSVMDQATGKQKPQAIMEYRLNGQYMIEGFTAGFLFVAGATGFILLNLITEKNFELWQRRVLMGVGIGCVVLSYNVLIMFLKMKVPGYLNR